MILTHILIPVSKILDHIITVRNVVAQGNVFTSVCHSVHRGESGQIPPLGRPPPPHRQADPPIPPGQIPPADGYCSGRYASYWNAFLFNCMYINLVCARNWEDENIKVYLHVTSNRPLWRAFEETVKNCWRLWMVLSKVSGSVLDPFYLHGHTRWQTFSFFAGRDMRVVRQRKNRNYSIWTKNVGTLH